jgi:hypothetical protein
MQKNHKICKNCIIAASLSAYLVTYKACSQAKNQILINDSFKPMWNLFFRSSRRKALGLEAFATTLKYYEIIDSYKVKGGNSYFKEAIPNLIIDKARQVIAKEYHHSLGWQCLNQPVGQWENNQFIYLSTLTEVSTCTLKRIIGHKCYAKTTDNVSPKVKEKIKNFGSVS